MNILNGGDKRGEFNKGGYAYTVAVLCALVFSLLFSLVTSAVASICNLTAEDLESSNASKLLNFLPGVLAIATTLIIFYKKNGKTSLTLLSVNRFKPKFLAVMILLPVGVLLGLGSLNTLFVSLLKKIGYSAPVAELPSFSAVNLTFAIIVIGILPPLFEELLFRGVITSSLKGLGKYPCALLVGGLFALYHMNPQQTIYQFLVGFIFTLIAIESESVIPTTVAHVINNLIVVFTEYFYPLKFSGVALLITTVIGLVILAVCLFLTISKKETVKEEGSFIKGIGIVGVIVCVFIWIVNLISYTL